MPNIPDEDTNSLAVVSVNEQRIFTLTSDTGEYRAIAFWPAFYPLKVGDNLIITNREASTVLAQRMSDGVEFHLVFDVDQGVIPPLTDTPSTL
jgi:hypothetical protein